ncbi:MAG: hypothetical protein K0B16_14595 [Burkholderiaceae bacterium]|nr:hypothetical protein [Burkholderiaceae bacterium]
MPRLRDDFGIEQLVMVGDRGMISNKAIDELRAHKRLELLAVTERNLGKIKARVDAGKLAGKDEIGRRIGKVINQYKMAKHFELAIGENTFSFARRGASIAAEAALDGIYIIRTSVPAARMDAPSCVRNTCCTPYAAPDAPSLEVSTTPNAKQEHALELLRQIRL